MKNLILTVFAFVGVTSKAQIVISNSTNPTLTNDSVLLEFGSEAKGIILPSVSSATGAVAGTFIVNTSSKAIQYYDGTAWIDLTTSGELVPHNFVNSGSTDIGNGVIMGATTTTKPGVLVLESTTKALVLPKVANPHQAILSAVAGTMVYDTVSDSIAVYDGANWSYWN